MEKMLFNHKIAIFLVFLETCSGEISTANNQFGLDLYSLLSSKIEGDFVFSPFLISSTSAYLHSSDTEESKLFHSGRNPDDIWQDYTRVLQDFKDLNPLRELKSLILDNHSTIRQNVTQRNGYPFVEVLISNFTNENATFDLIDSWLRENVNFPFDTRELWNEKFDLNQTLGLVSKSFFKGKWAHPFNPLFTKPSPFFYDETHSEQVEMMFQRGTVPFAQIDDLDCTAVALPYLTDFNDDDESSASSTIGDNSVEKDFHRLELIFLLPNERMGLSKVEEKLKTYPFSRITRQFMETKDLHLYIPKFVINTTLHLPQQDFPFPNTFQFARISVNENGSGHEVSNPKTNYVQKVHYNFPESFRLNRPFIGFLYDEEKHIVLNVFRKTR